MRNSTACTAGTAVVAAIDLACHGEHMAIGAHLRNRQSIYAQISRDKWLRVLAMAMLPRCRRPTNGVAGGLSVECAKDGVVPCPLSASDARLDKEACHMGAHLWITPKTLARVGRAARGARLVARVRARVFAVL